MRRACSVWCATSLAVLALLAGCAGERDRHVTQAQMTVVRLPHYVSEHPKPAVDAEWQTVSLPIRVLPAAGELRTDRYYYWFRIERHPDAADLGMLYVPRTANPGHPQIATTGEESYDDGRHNHGPNWNTPVAILFDAARLPSRRYVDFGVHRNGDAS